MKKTVSFIRLTDFERALSEKDAITIGRESDGSVGLDVINEKSDAGITLTQREAIEFGKAVLEMAGAQNISFQYTPKAS